MREAYVMAGAGEMPLLADEGTDRAKDVAPSFLHFTVS